MKRVRVLQLCVCGVVLLAGAITYGRIHNIRNNGYAAGQRTGVTASDSGRNSGSFALAPTSQSQPKIQAKGKGKSKIKKKRTTTEAQPARLEAWETTPLYSKIAGYVAKVHVDIGDEVTDLSKPLFTLSVPEMVVEEQQKLALVSLAKAQLEQARSAVEVARSKLETLTAKVKESQAGVTNALGSKRRWDAEFARLENLAKDGSVTKKLVDEARFQKDGADAALEAARAKVDSAKAALQEAKVAVKKTIADEKAAQASVFVATTNHRYTREMLRYLEVKPPYPGVIIDRNVDAGHFVQPSDAGKAKPFIVIAMTKKLRVVVEVPEFDAPFVRKGNHATIQVRFLGDKGIVKGKVSRTGFALNPRNSTLQVEIDIPNETGRFRPGMFAHATIELTESR
jgi:multidrug resistance efflux pump